MSEFLEFFASIWRLFDEIDVPGLGISFSELWLGAFVVCISIVILRPLLGIGGSASRIVTGIGKRSVDSARRFHQKEFGKKS